MIKKHSLIALLLAFAMLFAGCGIIESKAPSPSFSLDSIPGFDGETPYVVIDGNEPDFSEGQLVAESYEKYSQLDSLGRCGVTVACIGRDIMPTEERGSIGQVKPSGWKTVKYDIVDGKYLYNRCHLIGFQLTGENANEENLITGTRYMNVEGMLPFENMVADYVKETGNHVLYRVTPIFKGEELVARGVLMEAKSVEDGGEGVCFKVYVYNNQPGIEINYENGESKLIKDSVAQTETDGEYVLNTNTKKFHLTSCVNAEDIKSENKKIVIESAEALESRGYAPCKACIK